MSKKTGIWIDKKEAVVISLVGKSADVQRVSSGIKTRNLEPGERKKFERFEDQFMDFERETESKAKARTIIYLKNVIAAAADCESLIVFGASGIKNELKKRIQMDSGMAGRLAGVESVGNLTEEEKIDWVKAWYAGKK